MKKDEKYFRGCLVGGAVGDAMGWPVEFLKYKEIVKKYGSKGIKDLDLGNKNLAEITDDTQMTMFTAEGLLRAATRCSEKGENNLPSVIFHAYQRWLVTQGYNTGILKELDGLLINVSELHQQRAPGNTCLSALKSGKMGTIEQPINNSKGCGGVMRVAPVGLFCSRESAFEIGCESAALTHGHPSGYLSAGVLAHLIACIIEGMEIEDAVTASLEELKKHNGHEECSSLLEKAIALSRDNTEPLTALSQLGEGWVGEETIAIAVYCSLKEKNNFKKALLISVNHDGDSDSTGAVTGNILGAYLGIDAIPAPWLQKVEFADLLIQLADDLLIGYQDTEEWRSKYPGW
ncbi:MAG: ADP-ribosylglycohydrolase family protein [Syntrophomonadaceae bacterium]|nr:ADP-ribosylglycohydrolase family protein [Syntrophomonadaceae bacterium]